MFTMHGDVVDGLTVPSRRASHASPGGCAIAQSRSWVARLPPSTRCTTCAGGPGIFSEMRRVVKPSGRILVAELTPDGFALVARGPTSAAPRQIPGTCRPGRDRDTAASHGGAGGLDPVAREELLRRVRRRDVVVLDVRPPEEYAAGHIAGSLSIPLAELRRRLARLPATREVVAYRRGPYCVLAAEAVRLLRQHGRRATRLADGYPEWRDAGLPVEVGGPLPANTHGVKETR